MKPSGKPSGFSANICKIVVFAAVFAAVAGHAAGADAGDDIRAAARGVLGRVIPGSAADIGIEYVAPENGLDVFEIDAGPSGPVIRGSSVPAVMMGVNWYLKYHCGAHVSWTGDQLDLPDPLPAPDEKTRIVSPYRYRYMYNYCTFNYTMSFWDWEDWERELDFLALNGVNLALAVVGQEAVWRNVMRRMGMGEEEIAAFIPGPAFQAWWLMGNLEGWGGPVSQAWIEKQSALQKKILSRMRELGIEPVLQGFYGMAPVAMIEKFPDARIYRTGKWCAFERPAMVDPADDFFDRIASVWYDEQRKLYGEAKYFGGDPFHEGGGADIDLTDAGRNIQRAMLDAHPGSVWVIQAWQSNPRKELLDGTVKENTLLLDLFGETNPQWSRREGFYGHPWVWNIISNFGGNTGIFGTLGKVARDPVEALHSPARGNMAGIGAMLEASMQDAVLWDLLFEMGWRGQSPDLDSWVAAYADRRYGGATPAAARAWKILEDTAYTPTETGRAEPESPMCARPGFNITKAWGNMERGYDTCEFARAWELLAGEAEKYRGVETFEHDLVNVSRQALANLALDYNEKISRAFEAGDREAFDELSSAYLVLIADQDRLLATDDHYMLGKWIADARSLGSTEQEKDLFEWNARTQITTWGPRESAEILHEYAHREWSGLLRGFYYKRWETFFRRISKRFDDYARGPSSGREAFDSFISEITYSHETGADPTGTDWYALEEKWTHMKEPYSAEPEGDPADETRRVFEKYYPEIRAACGP